MQIRYPMGGEGLYNIGGVLFSNGVAEVDELTHAQREVLAWIGAEIDDEPVEPPKDDAPVAPPAEPVEPQQPAADAPTGPEEIPTETSLQEAATPFEATSTDSTSEGDETIEPAVGRHAGDTSGEGEPEA